MATGNHYDLARVYTSTSGTGTMTLTGTVSGFLSFDDAGVGDGETVTYSIREGANTEVGRGVYTASGTTLTRAVVLASTNSGSAITLGGTAEVAIVYSSSDIAIAEIVDYSSSGTFAKADYPGMVGVVVTVIGGGGGGGGTPTAGGGTASSGGGGAGGGTSIKYIPVNDLGTSETVTVGAAGSAGTAAHPTSVGSGGTSSFGAHCSATGGAGGGSHPASTNNGAAGGAGGAGSGGDIDLTGGGGGTSHTINGLVPIAGTGGSTFLGGVTGIPATFSAVGNAGASHGSGGCGGCTNTSTARAGGAGAAGRVVVEVRYA